MIAFLGKIINDAQRLRKSEAQQGGAIERTHHILPRVVGKGRDIICCPKDTPLCTFSATQPATPEGNKWTNASSLRNVAKALGAAGFPDRPSPETWGVLSGGHPTVEPIFGQIIFPPMEHIKQNTDAKAVFPSMSLCRAQASFQLIQHMFDLSSLSSHRAKRGRSSLLYSSTLERKRCSGTTV